MTVLFVPAAAWLDALRPILMHIDCGMPSAPSMSRYL
jgi:hypothetical protein